MLPKVLLFAAATSFLGIFINSSPAHAWCSDATGKLYYDAPGDKSTLCNIFLGGSNGDAIDGRDVDWFRVNLVAGTTYRFHALIRGDGDLRLEILDSNGSQLAYNDDASKFTKNPIIGFAAPYTGLYYAKVIILPSSIGLSGYNIVRTLTNPSVSCPRGAVPGFNRGQELRGKILPGGSVSYCFGGAAGSYVAFTVAPLAGAADPMTAPTWTWIDGTTGQPISFQYGVGRARFELGPMPKTGLYILKIEGSRLLDGTGEYVLRRLE